MSPAFSLLEGTMTTAICERVRERADVLAYEAERNPATAHIAQLWLVNALRWASLRDNASLERHLSLRIAGLSRHRREEMERTAFARQHPGAIHA